MKRTFILAALFLVCMPVVFSQVKPFRFGLKIAPSVGWLTPDSEDLEKNGSMAGFSWGFISDFAITENYFVGTGFNINYLNGRLKYPHSMDIIEESDTTTVTGTMKRKYKLGYIELPVTLKMKTNKFDAIQVFGQIGFSASFNIRAKSVDDFSYKINDVYHSESDERDISDDIKLVKGALILGGGIEYFVDNSTSVLVGLKYSNGITNILKSVNTADPSIDQKATPYFIELSLGVIF